MSNELLTIDDNYTMKRIVYINSAGCGYSEMRLDQHLAIYGRNNAGKTSLLAGTKIMLFPETSFRKCEKKFMFVDKHGNAFNAEDSYLHYFPDARSFIILEVENPHGIFSMICYRTNNYKYARFFIPTNYSDIRELFCNEDGELNPELSIKLIDNICKELNGARISDKKELTELMFGSRLDVLEKSRFCVLPLRDAKSGTVEALRNIYQLAFDGGSSSTTTLPATLATLVEMKRGRRQEQLDANLISLIEARRRLEFDSERIQELENAKKIFESTAEQLETTRTAMSKYSNKYHTLTAGIIEFRKSLVPQKQHCEAESARLYGIYKNSKDELEKGEDKLKELRADYRAVDKLLNEDDKKLKSAIKVRESYSTLSDTLIIRDLMERQEDYEKELKTFKEEGGAAKKHQDLVKEQNGLRVNRDNLKIKLSESQKLLFSMLKDDHAVSVLHTLNPKLSGVSYNLREEQKQIVTDFAAMFGFDATGLMTFNGNVIDPELKELPFDEQEQIIQWQDELEKVEGRLHELDNEIPELSTLLKNGDDVEAFIEDTKDQIKQITFKLEKIQSIKTLEESVEEKTRDVDRLKLEGQDLAAKVEGEGELKLRMQQDFANFQKVEEQLTKITLQEQMLEELTNQLDTAKSIHMPMPVRIEGENIPTELTKEMGLVVLKSVQAFNEELQALRDRYLRLAGRTSHPDIDKHRNISDFSDMERNIGIYQNTYSGLEIEKEKLTNEIKGHNNVLSSQLSELREARQSVIGEIAEINVSLNENTVSNLSGVSLKVDFEPTFLNIMNTLDKHDITGESLLSDDFYQTLSTLINGQYYNNKTGRIQLRDIIKSVRYGFTKKDSGLEETKGQSGGTTTTITSFVLSVLLNRISEAHTKLGMPIIIDEIGTVDSQNRKATIEQVSRHGFSVFCATPEYIAAVSQYLGRHIHIDKNNLAEPMVESCHMKCLPLFVEHFGEHANAD